MSAPSVLEAEENASFQTTAFGLSPTRLGIQRLRRDRLAVAGFGVVVFFVVIAVFAPILVQLLNIDPYELDRNAINEFGLPAGSLGGISFDHPLGVEPGT